MPLLGRLSKRVHFPSLCLHRCLTLLFVVGFINGIKLCDLLKQRKSFWKNWWPCESEGPRNDFFKPIPNVSSFPNYSNLASIQYPSRLGSVLFYISCTVFLGMGFKWVLFGKEWVFLGSVISTSVAARLLFLRARLFLTMTNTVVSVFSFFLYLLFDFTVP